MTDDPLAAKKRIDEVLEALRVGLTPYVVQRMEGSLGKNWRSYASRAVIGEGIFALDTYGLLKTILDHWREAFSSEAKLRKARSYISLALDARNAMSHFVGAIEQRAALRYLDAILEVLRAIEARVQEEIVFKLYAEQQSGVHLVWHVEGHPLAVEKSTGAPPEHIPVDFSVVAAKVNARVVTTQTQADRIRRFAVGHYIAPARRNSLGEITIRAGDVHRAMGLANAMPAVCSAIGNKRFAEVANVRLSQRTGPANGANVYFRFELDSQPTPEYLEPATPPGSNSTAASPKEKGTLDLYRGLILVSCVKSKLAHAATARTLYTSPWFRGVRELVESSGARWFVLSSRYGLVDPDAVIAPYDYTLNSLGVAARKVWAKNVLDELLPQVEGYGRIVMFAGDRYREFLVGPLEQRGIIVDVPMKYLRRGEQLAWLNQHH